MCVCVRFTCLIAATQSHVVLSSGGWCRFALVDLLMYLHVFFTRRGVASGRQPVCVFVCLCVCVLASLGCTVCAQKANQVNGQEEFPARPQCLQQLWQQAARVETTRGSHCNVSLQCFTAMFHCNVSLPTTGLTIEGTRSSEEKESCEKILSENVQHSRSLVQRILTTAMDLWGVWNN